LTIVFGECNKHFQKHTAMLHIGHIQILTFPRKCEEALIATIRAVIPFFIFFPKSEFLNASSSSDALHRISIITLNYKNYVRLQTNVGRPRP
jgi:hypothetical protein